MKSNDLTARAKEMQREYVREWRRKNKDKVRAYNETYWRRKAEREGGLANAKTGTD